MLLIPHWYPNASKRALHLSTEIFFPVTDSSSSFAECSRVPEPLVSRGCSHTPLWLGAARKAAHQASKQTSMRLFPSREQGVSSLPPGVGLEVEAVLTGFIFAAEAPPFAGHWAVGSFPCQGPAAALLLGLLAPLPGRRGGSQAPGVCRGLCSM